MHRYWRDGIHSSSGRSTVTVASNTVASLDGTMTHGRLRQAGPFVVGCFRPIVLKMSSGNNFGMSQTSKQSVIVQ